MPGKAENKNIAAPLKDTSEIINVGNAAVGLTPPAAATRAIIYVESNAIRFWIDGSTPTASNGLSADIDDTIMLDTIESVTNFKCISSSASVQAKLNVAYEG